MTLANRHVRKMLASAIVMVIDDDPLSLQVARIILEHHSATVHTACNGEEGLALTKQIRPHFVISDLSMPVMDGWTFVRQMKMDDAMTTIPVIALTAHAMTNDRERALAAGFDGYLTKPLTPATFIGDLMLRLLSLPTLTARLALEANP